MHEDIALPYAIGGGKVINTAAMTEQLPNGDAIAEGTPVQNVNAGHQRGVEVLADVVIEPELVVLDQPPNDTRRKGFGNARGTKRVGGLDRHFRRPVERSGRPF